MKRSLTTLSLVLVLSLITVSVAAAQVSGYAFSGSAGTYTQITGGTVLGTTANDDDNFNALPIGFTFTYNGTAYTQVSVNTNGFLAMGATVVSSYTAISSGTSNNVVVANNKDLQGQTGSELSYLSRGSAPNRTLTVQWKGYRHKSAAGDSLNFQITLSETSNKIEVAFGSFTQNGTNRTVQVGLRGASSADFNNRSVVNGVTTWATSTAGATNTATCELRTALVPASGLTYTWQLTQSYTSSTTTQNTDGVVANTTNQQIIGIQIVMTGSVSPLSVTQFNLSTNGTTSTSDISNAKLFYTGTSNIFSTATQYGSTVASPGGAFTIAGTQTLAAGTNYFWVTFDITPGATAGHVVDAECNSITGSGTMGTVVPSIQAPAGSRTILAPLAAGSYTVGLALFNRATGRNVSWEKRSHLVTREIPAGGSVQPTKMSDRSPSVLERASAGQETRIARVMEDYYVLTENGVPYTGPFYAPLSRNTEGGMSSLGIYPTITAAVADLNLRGVAGPVRFLLVDATYPSETYPIAVNVTRAVPTATNTVTFKPATGVTSTVSGSYAGPLWQVVNTNYVTLDGSNINGGTTRDLTIENTSATGNVVIVNSTTTTPVSNVTIKNCVLRNGATSYTAVIVGARNGTNVDSTYFDKVTIMNNSIQKAYVGVYAHGGTSPQHGSNLTLEGNALNSPGDNVIRTIGLYVQGVNRAVVRGNDVGSFSTSESENDIGIWLARGTINSVVEKNTIHDLNYTGAAGYGGKGIMVSSEVAPCNDTLRNNMIYNISGDGEDYATYGFDRDPIAIYIFSSPQTGVNVFFNSVYMFGNTINKTNAYSIGVAVSASSALIKDNIIVNNLGIAASTGAGPVAVAVDGPASALAGINYNDYYCNATGSTNNIGKIGANDYATLAAWQVAVGGDANSRNVSVSFVSPTDLHLSGASLSDANLRGTPIAGITTDFDGDARDVLTPFMGADEGLNSLRANVKVLLQGPYNTGTSQMDNALRTSGILAAHFTGATIPATAVDSINIEIRNAPTAAGSTIRKFAPAWLLQNGSIVDFTTPASSYVSFTGAPDGNYYIVVRHRNHLAIMTATARALSASTPPAYDFTTGQSQAFGTNPMVLVNPGVYAMYAGDVNQSALVSAADANLVFGVLNATGYNLNDANLSGVVSAADANLVFSNLNATSNVSRPVESVPLPIPLRPTKISENVQSQ